MTPQELSDYLAELIQQHNGLVGEPRVVDPQVEETKTLPSGQKVVTGTAANPTPIYEYRFRDGEYIQVKASGYVPGQPGGSFEVLKGTAGVEPSGAKSPTLIQTDKGKVPYNLSDLPAGEVIPGTETTKTPDTQLINGNLFQQQPDGSYKLLVDKTQTPGYQAPTPQQGPAFSGTQAGMDYASSLRDAEDEKKLERHLRKLQLEYEAGYKELPAVQREAEALIAQASAERNQRYALERQERQTAAARELAAEQSQQRQEEFDRNERPYKDEAVRVQREAAATGRRTAEAAAFSKRAEAGLDIINKSVATGVQLAPGDYGALYFDPHKRALDLLGQAMTVPDFDPQARALDVIGRQQPVAPTAPAPMAAPPAASAPAPLDNWQQGR